jgi:hypothetical protein
MSAEPDAICGAPYGERSPARAITRNRYRPGDFDARTANDGRLDPQAARGLPPRRLAARSSAADVPSGRRGRDLLPAWGFHPAKRSRRVRSSFDVLRDAAGRTGHIRDLLGQKPTPEAKFEQEAESRGEVFAQVNARFRKRRQVFRCPCAWSRGRRV